MHYFSRLFQGREALPNQSSLSPSKSLFEYQSIDEESIRILTLLPGSLSDPICCKLEVVPRSSDTKYSALSYTWGLESDVRQRINIVNEASSGGIYSDSRHILVRPNLHGALVALRAKFSPDPKRLWVDAICIDQSSNVEKQQQVRHMSSVYFNALDVIIWLGESGSDSQFILDSISRKDNEAFVTQRFMAGILGLLEREWFTRTWIVQEFVLNKRSPIIACGTADMVDWEQFREAYITAFPWAEGTGMPHNVGIVRSLFLARNEARFRILHHTYTMLNSFRKGVQSNSDGLATYALRYALWATLPFKATDARDKVYGVLGMTDTEVKEKVMPDYTKSKEEVFRDAILYILQVERMASIYAYLPLKNIQTRGDHPSWVPNIDKAIQIFGISPQLFDVDHFPQYNADVVTLSTCKRRLLTKGLLLGEIETVIVHPASELNESNQQSFWVDRWNKCFMLTQFVDLIQAYSAQSGTPPTTEPLWKLMLLSTATSDNFRNDQECEFKFDLLMTASREIVAIGQQRSLLSKAMSITKAALSIINRFNASDPVSGQILLVCSQCRRFFACHEGWYGIAEGDVRKGDRLALLFPGANMPFILRPTTEGVGTFQMIGGARIPEDARMREASQRASHYEDITLV